LFTVSLHVQYNFQVVAYVVQVVCVCHSGYETKHYFLNVNNTTNTTSIKVRLTCRQNISLTLY